MKAVVFPLIAAVLLTAGLALSGCNPEAGCGCQEPVTEFDITLHGAFCPLYSDDDWREYERRAREAGIDPYATFEDEDKTQEPIEDALPLR